MAARIDPELDAHFRRYVRSWVDAAFMSEREIRFAMSDLLTELEAPNEAYEKELVAWMKALLAEHQSAEAKWTKPTDNDRLTAALVALEKRDILVLENAGMTMSDGWSDVREAVADRKKPYRGGGFYHAQDIDLALDGHGLHLAFDTFVETPKESRKQRWIAIGEEIVETLKAHELPTKWNGTVKDRILITPFEWRRRRKKRR